MTVYILRRLLLFIPTMLLVSLIVFVLMRAIPGSAIDTLFAQEAGPAAVQGGGAGYLSQEDRQRLARSLGIDKPLPVQYVTWIWGAVRFDFGESLFQQKSNRSIIAERLPRSMEIAFIAVAIALVYGVTLGIISAVKQDTWIDYVARVLAIGGISMPSFFVAVMLFYFLILAFNWIPPFQFHDLVDNPLENLKQIAAPSIVLGLGAGASISRLTRSQALEVLREDSVRTARAKGLGQTTVVLRHVLRNSLLPIITVAGLLMGVLLAGTVIVEQVYSIPGMGRTILTAVNNRDYPLIQAQVWVMSLIFMSSNLIVDIAYGWVDPRIRFR